MDILRKNKIKYSLSQLTSHKVICGLELNNYRYRANVSHSSYIKHSLQDDLLLGLQGPSQHATKSFPKCEDSEGDGPVLRGRFHFPRNRNVSAMHNLFLFSIPKPSTFATKNSLSPQINGPCPVFFTALSKAAFEKVLIQ